MFKVPYKALGSEFQRASKSGLWLPLGQRVDRDFDEVEKELNSLRRFPNQRVYSYVATADRSTSSASYVNWPVGEVFTTGTFTKRRLDTRLTFTFLGSGFMTVAAGIVAIAFRIDGTGTDYGLKVNGFINGLSDHQEITGAAEVSGIAAGDHTFTIRAKTDGTATYHADPNDSLRFVVTEAA